MITGINSTPPGTPNLGCGEEGNLTRHSCENGTAVRPRVEVALGRSPSVPTALLHSSMLCAAQGRELGVSAPARIMDTAASGGKEKEAPRTRKKLTYIYRGPNLWSLIGPPSCK